MRRAGFFVLGAALALSCGGAQATPEAGSTAGPTVVQTAGATEQPTILTQTDLLPAQPSLVLLATASDFDIPADAVLACVLGVVFFLIVLAAGLTFWENAIFAVGIIVANVPYHVAPDAVPA